MVKYETNFEKFPGGNGIKEGSELIVKIIGAEVITGQIRDVKNRIITIAQSHKNDEDRNAETINIKLKRRRWLGLKNDNLPAGKYVLIVWYFDYDTMMGGSFTDKFLIA